MTDRNLDNDFYSLCERQNAFYDLEFDEQAELERGDAEYERKREKEIFGE